MKNFKKYFFFLATNIIVSCYAMEQGENYYDLLGVSSKASQEEITKKINSDYENLIKDGLETDRQKQKEFRKKVVAYMILSDPEKLKKLYDARSPKFEPPYRYYEVLDVPVHVPFPFAEITPENCNSFFTEISREEISRAFTMSRKEEECISYMYEMLNDPDLKKLYDTKAIESAFKKARNAISPRKGKLKKKPTSPRWKSQTLQFPLNKKKSINETKD